MGGDRVSAELVRDLPAQLEPGGYASVMISWIQEGDLIGPRVQSWVDGTRVDALLLHAAVTAAESAASQWNRDLAADQDRYDAAVDEWNAYFRAEGIEAIGYGTLVLRRRDSAEPWFSVLALSSHLGGQGSTQLLRLFEATNAAQADDDALLGLRLVPVPTARLLPADDLLIPRIRGTSPRTFSPVCRGVTTPSPTRCSTSMSRARAASRPRPSRSTGRTGG